MNLLLIVGGEGDSLLNFADAVGGWECACTYNLRLYYLGNNHAQGRIETEESAKMMMIMIARM